MGEKKLESDLKKFLMNTEYVDFWEPAVQAKARELFPDQMNDIQKTETAFLFVRDEVKHSFDIEAAVITSKASDVLKYKTKMSTGRAAVCLALDRKERSYGEKGKAADHRIQDERWRRSESGQSFRI